MPGATLPPVTAGPPAADSPQLLFWSADPICPAMPLPSMEVPLIVVIMTAISVTGFVLSILVSSSYNHVRVLNRQIRTGHISNTHWMVYFMLLGMRGACSSLTFSFSGHKSASDYGAPLLKTGAFLHACVALSLTAALNHQRIYRSAAAPPNPSMRYYRVLGWKFQAPESISRMEVAYYLLFGLTVVSLLLEIASPSDSVSKLYIAAFCLQRVPVLVLVASIALMLDSEEGDVTFGPPLSTRMYLVAGALFNIVLDFPLAMWMSWLPHTCFFDYVSWLDIIEIFYFLSLVFFFLFLRREFLRNVEECIWTTVSQIQDDNLQFRHFS